MPTCRPNPLRQVFFKRILAHPPGRPAVELSLFVPSPDYYSNIPPTYRKPDFDAVYKAAAAQQHLPQSQSPWAIVPSVLRMVADQVDGALRDAESSPNRRVEDGYQQQQQQPAKDTKSSRLPASPSPSSPAPQQRPSTLAEVLTSSGNNISAPKRLRRTTLSPSPRSPGAPRSATATAQQPTKPPPPSPSIPITLAEARGRNQLTPPRRLRPSQLSPYEVRETKKAGNNNNNNNSMVLQQSDESVVTASVTDSSWIDTHTGPSTPHTSTSLSLSVSGVPAKALRSEDGHGGGGWDAGGDRLDGNRDGVEGPDTHGLGDLLDLDLP